MAEDTGAGEPRGLFPHRAIACLPKTLHLTNVRVLTSFSIIDSLFDLLSFNSPASGSLGQNIVKHNSCPVVPKPRGCDGSEFQTRVEMYGDVSDHRALGCWKRFDLV